MAYSAEKVEIQGQHYHKGCVVCSDPACGIKLSLKSLKTCNGKLWCEKHLPKPKHVNVADRLDIQYAKLAPHRVAEGLGHVQKGTGESPTISLESLTEKHQMLIKVRN